MTGGATSQTYSFLQLTAYSRLRTRADLANFEAVKYVQKLSESMHSAALAQLANRMAAAARMGAAAGEDPFAKVKGLISEMIERLLKEAAEDAAHKAYCDKEMSETKAKKEELTDKMTADSAKLKEEVAVLSKELADLAKSQAEMDKVREEEKVAKENEIAKVTKEQDVKYKTKEAKTLSKAAAE